MDAARWQEIRELFDAVCELPPSRWEPTLRAMSADPATIDEVLSLLDAQTMQLQRASGPVATLLANLPDAQLQPGDRLDGWRLGERVASGGMGSVFVADRADGLFKHRVAIKLLRGFAGPVAAQRLAAERQILASLQHPGIARLYDGGTTPTGQPYLVLEYVDGLPLDEYADRQNLRLRARIALFQRVCAAVSAAHRQLVVHCDLKPGNVLVRGDGEPVLLDFGIARLLAEHGEDSAAGYGTAGYASPEQLAGDRIGVASDVYGLGALLCRLIAGRAPVVEDGRMRAPSAMATAATPWHGELRGDLDAIVLKACDADPERRYATVDALSGDLQRYLDRRPVLARPQAPGYRASRFLARRWKESIAASLALALCAAFVWQLSEQRERAEHEAAVAKEVSDLLLKAFAEADPKARGARGTQVTTARDVLDSGAAQLERMTGSPDVLARQRAVIGMAYQNLGETQRAEPLMRRAADELIAVGAEAEAAAVLSELAVLLGNDKRGDDAVAVGRRSLELRERIGAEPLAIADSYNSLGIALNTQGDTDAAVAALEKALATRREYLGKDAQAVTVTLQNLAMVHRSQGEYKRAERMYREALALRRRDSERSYGVLVARDGLAKSLNDQGRQAEAAVLLRQNVELARELYDDRGDHMASAHSELASTLQDMGDYANALPNYRRALEITVESGGEGTMQYAIDLNNMATLLEARGELAAAEAAFRQSLRIRRANLPPDDRSVVRAEGNLARLQMRRGQMRESRPVLEQGIEQWRRKSDKPTPELVIAMLGMVEWYTRDGQLDAAQALLDRTPALPEESPNLALRRLGLRADIAQRRGDWPQAQALWAKVVEGNGGRDPVMAAKARVPYAESLLGGGRRDEARREAELAQAPLRAALVEGAEPLQRLQALEGRLSKG
ncbi:serine/threonine-protein kinase [Lysobacter auxotrophicus]|uniref:Serine/threonine-protein kinase n=1 Tax=Lysobacter auxotrophicus TaxID=2992573 RepID=A0ABM8DCU6_9GAMM|nr:serine/threonine-protein kinase [Lysobacter auxotrophicus]BDU16413.1 serine/threonine-protein kinase [Lysobacter auxotrophicus]